MTCPPGHVPTLQEAVEYYTPEAQPIIAQLVEAAIERGEDWDQELPVVTASGRRIWVRTIGRAIVEGGRCVRLLGCFQDISERVRARQECEDILSHARAYELLCNDAHELMSIGSDDGRLLQINKAGLAMLGCSREELVGESFASLVHPDDLEQSTRAALRLRELPAQRVTMTNRVRCRDGRWLWLEWTASCREGGRIYAVARDVTELRAHQENLKRLALIANQTHNAILITDRDGRISWANSVFEQLCGHSMDAVVCRRPGELLQGPETDPATVDRMREQLVRGEGFDVEIVNYRCDGTTYWAALEVQPIIGEDGQTTGFMGTQNNITEQKRAEQERPSPRLTPPRPAASTARASGSPSTRWSPPSSSSASAARGALRRGADGLPHAQHRRLGGHPTLARRRGRAGAGAHPDHRADRQRHARRSRTMHRGRHGRLPLQAHPHRRAARSPQPSASRACSARSSSEKGRWRKQSRSMMR
jgi:PAS domain S-box-containing protein